jgi:hypothetical protein
VRVEPQLVRLDAASVEAVARRLAELLRETTAPPSAPELSAAGGLLTAAEVARRVGTTPAWVRANAGLLSAVRLGEGPRPRLRFPEEAVAAALTARTDGKRSVRADRPVRRRKSNSRPPVTPSGCPLLPVRGSEV